MNIKKNITINLPEDDVAKIIAEYCNKNSYKVKPDVVLVLVQVSITKVFSMVLK